MRLSWARLFERVFEFDIERYLNCGGELKIIAAILEQPVIERILTHLGLLRPRTTAGTSERAGATGGLTAVIHRSSSGLAPPVAGIGCVRAFSGLSETQTA